MSENILSLTFRKHAHPIQLDGESKCRIIGLVYNDGCIALRPRPVYMRVQDLGGKAPRDTYGSLRYVYLQLPNIL